VRLLDFFRPREKKLGLMQPVTAGTGAWFGLIREAFTGAWQHNIEWKLDTVLAHCTLFSVRSLITSDVSKLRLRLVENDVHGIWRETENPAFSPVLRKPNRYQTRIQFIASWVDSKLIHGNTYVWKGRDERRIVDSLHVLNPELVTVFVAPDGAVYYQLRGDMLTGVPEDTLFLPASEIIHDRWNAYNHPMVGISPIHACGLAANQGLKIQNNSTTFFSNGSKPSGVVKVPAEIPIDKAREISRIWDERPPGATAVLTGGADYVPLTMSAADAQLLEQQKWTSEAICSAFHVPAYMVGVGPAPSYNNIEALNQQYYSQCLQVLIEEIELLLDDGLRLGKGFGNSYGTEFDLTDLLRMDTSTKTKAAADAVGSGAMSPDEARKRYFDLGPVEGGASPYMQIQNYSLSALHKRDQNSSPVTPGLGQPVNSDDKPNEETEDNGGSDEARAAYLSDILRRAQPHYLSRPS
jgi:HK97 family phage portal protein